MMVYSGFIGYDLNVADAEGCREMRRFVDDFLDEISRLTGINYDRDEKVMNVLSLHLKALMQRARAGNYSPNPIIAQIKNLSLIHIFGAAGAAADRGSGGSMDVRGALSLIHI